MSDQFQIEFFDHPDQLATAAATLTVKTLSAVPAGQPALLALSGGRIARDYFRSLINVWRDGRAHFFWADERCVLPTSPDSNFHDAFEILLKPLEISEDRIHRIRGELLPEQAASEAGETLRRVSKTGASALPCLDLVILGMGEDGHVASLFPGGLQTSPGDTECFLPVLGPKPPHRRVTMSWELLQAASDVLVLISGAGKETALRDALSSPTSNPLGNLLQLRDQTTLLSTVRP
jgi:6-phosphogluconolactonase